MGHMVVMAVMAVMVPMEQKKRSLRKGKVGGESSFRLTKCTNYSEDYYE